MNDPKPSPHAKPLLEVRLWDSQWVNVVNAPEVLNAVDTVEAVQIAVRMTESFIARNVASGNLPPADEEVERLTGYVQVWEQNYRGEKARAERLEAASRRVTAAFRAYGETMPFTREAERTRQECETAMLSLDAALKQEAK